MFGEKATGLRDGAEDCSRQYIALPAANVRSPNVVLVRGTTKSQRQKIAMRSRRLTVLVSIQVTCKIWRRQSMERHELYEHRDSLADRQPVQLVKN